MVLKTPPAPIGHLGWRVLRALLEDGGALTVDEIREAVGESTPKFTVNRAIVALRRRGLVTKTVDGWSIREKA